MTEKAHLYLDFDDTITNSLSEVVDIMNEKYNKQCKPENVKCWNFTDCFPKTTGEEILSVFESKKFWKELTLKDDVISSLQKLQNEYTIHIMSKGTKKNLEKKAEWIKKNIKRHNIEVDFIPIDINDSKGSVVMEKKSIAIDDNQYCLNECNATLKILFSSYGRTQWNMHWDGMRVNCWNELSSALFIQAKLFNGTVSK